MSILNSLPEPLSPLFDPLYIIVDDAAPALVIADLHCPYYSREWLAYAIEIALDKKASKVIIAGDLCNFEALSTFSKNQRCSDVYENDIAVANGILTRLSDLFKHVYICPGNHDNLWMKKNGGSFAELIYDQIMENKHCDNIITTERDYFLYKNFIIGHLESYDRVPGKLASEIAEREHLHTLVGHDHLTGAMRSYSGWWGMSIGCMTDATNFWYVARRLNTLPTFYKGFAIIDNSQLFHHHMDGIYSYSI